MTRGLSSVFTGLMFGLALFWPARATLAAPFEPEPLSSPELPDAPAQPLIIEPYRDTQFDAFRQYGRQYARNTWHRGLARDGTPPESVPHFDEYSRFKHYTNPSANIDSDYFLKGRYNRSRARLPENIEAWRLNPDIANPGPDLANFPNSAFTLPQGRVYLEFSPFTYYGLAQGSPEQYNMEFLLRYGATDNIELRVFGNGPAWTGGPYSDWSFSPLAFDTKIQLWTEKPDIYVPAAGFEAYIQTQWLGNSATNSGTQPGFTFNFDQSLPLDIDLEYNIGAIRSQNYLRENEWSLSFQWALQRDFFDGDIALFVHGFLNAMTLPRLPNVEIPPADRAFEDVSSLKQDAIGGGFVWTIDTRVAMYGQTSAGLNKYTPALISFVGFAVAF